MATTQTKNIVYIEDREEDIALLKRVIDREYPGVSLITVDDSEAALKQIEQDEFKNYLPKLLLIDINMPKVSGFEILQALKNKEDYKKIPKVIFSSSTQPTDVDKAYSLQCNSYIEKPATYKELKEIISATINYWLHFNVN